MAKQKMIHSEETALVMTPFDETANHVVHEMKQTTHIKRPKHSMQLKSGKALIANEPAELEESELAEIKAGHPETYEGFFHV